MNNLSAGNERERLTGVYSAMADGELEEVAADATSLTQVAREVLQAELARRSLDIPLEELSLEAPKPVPDNLVTIRQFRDLPEALLAKGALESAGIESFLLDDNMIRMDWFISNLLGGIKLAVREDDAQPADNVLSQAPPESFPVEGVGDFDQPRCPECQSVDVSFEALNKPVAYTTAWLGVPVPLSRKIWKCHSCGHHWKEYADG